MIVFGFVFILYSFVENLTSAVASLKRACLVNILKIQGIPVTCLFRHFPPVSFKGNTCPNGQVLQLTRNKF